MRSENSRNRFKRLGESAARQHKKIQNKLKRVERAHGSRESKKAMQAGARRYPVPPFPGKPLKKPGLELSLELPPMYDAPYYKGSSKLGNKVAIITGGDSGIGRAVAVLFAREGCDVTVVYLNEHRDAAETRCLVERENRKCIIIPGDVSERNFCKYVVEETMAEFGRLDILVNNAAFQLHVAA